MSQPETEIEKLRRLLNGWRRETEIESDRAFKAETNLAIAIAERDQLVELVLEALERRQLNDWTGRAQRLCDWVRRPTRPKGS